MAEFKGFGYTSPAEIKTQMNQMFSQQMASGNPAMMRAAIAQQAALNIGGTPQLREAIKTEKVLKNAAANQEDTGDEINDQISFYEEAQKAALEAELPHIAVQATERLSELRLVQEERARLKAREGREVAQEERSKAAHDLQMGADQIAYRHLRNGMLIDPTTLRVIDRGDLSNIEDIKRMEEKKAGTDFTMITESEYLELTEAEKDRKNKLAMLGSGIAGRSSLYKDWYKKTQTTDAFAVTSSDFVDLLMLDDAETLFAIGGETRGLGEKLSSHAKSLFANPSYGLDEEDSPENRFVQVLAGKPELERRWNALSEDRQALIMDLGYALATSREGGRLTDQDVERAIISLGVDNPDPQAVAWIFGRALKRTRDTYARSLVTSGVEDVEKVRNTHQMVLAQLDENLERLSSKYKIDFDDEKKFRQYVDPAGAFSESQSSRGTVVRPVGDSGRNKPRVRDYTGNQ